MPSSFKKICNKVGCPNLVDIGEKYCEQHRHLEKEQKAERHRHYDKNIRHKRDRKYTEFYHSPEWEAVRKQALIRDKGLCKYCLKNNRITLADMVHHIVSIKEDWSKRLDLDNLVSLCNTCHNRIPHKG